MTASPTRIDLDLCRALWAHAATCEFGIAIETDDVRFLQTNLYKVRQKAGLNAWADLMICLPEGGTHIFIVKKTADEALT